jgi:hypothetical protein
MDLEAAKTATVDSMEVNGKAKSDRFHAGRNDKGRNPKETIIVNQPEITTTTTTTTERLKSTRQRSCNWCRCWCSYWSHYK